MKEKYIKPDSDIQKFAAVDVITTSGGAAMNRLSLHLIGTTKE